MNTQPRLLEFCTRRLSAAKCAKILFIAIIGLSTLASNPARANIILVGPDVIKGNGFGADPRALTIQSHSPSNNSESGCIAPTTGGSMAGGSACAPSDGDIGGDETDPIGFPKQEIGRASCRERVSYHV